MFSRDDPCGRVSIFPGIVTLLFCEQKGERIAGAHGHTDTGVVVADRNGLAMRRLELRKEYELKYVRQQTFRRLCASPKTDATPEPRLV